MRTRVKTVAALIGVCVVALPTYILLFNIFAQQDGSNTQQEGSNTQQDDFIFDHSYNNINQIPESWIDTVQDSVKLHYAHTSHGGQMTTGLSSLEASDSRYSQIVASSSLPTETGALCIFDGQTSNTYIEPDDYWASSGGINDTYSVIDNNPSLTLSMWCWCRQVDDYSTSQIQEYLNQMDSFEQHYSNNGRNVRFIYMTGNCDTNESSGYNRYLNNQLIREFCNSNDKILLDFGDIECWLYDDLGNAYDHSTYDYDTGDGIVSVPIRHAEYDLDIVGHTTFVNCENKAKVFWWMLARIAGWNGI